jgi:ribosomal protein S18 acetylase RimI-like enzyme
MNIRPVREEDIEAIINLFRANYGDDYAIPEFYDPQWVKRGVYSDHILWLVIEDEGRVVASGACILNAGDYNDQIGEIGRLVVDPEAGGKGLGRALLAALVDASDERVEFAFAEARTTHPKTQKICERIGLAPLGFLPMYYQMTWRESWVLCGQLFGNGRTLRRPGAADVIPPVAPLAELSLKNLELDERLTVRDAHAARPYPHDMELRVSPLTGAAMVRLLRIEHGRLIEPEVFSAMHLDLGYSHLRAQKADYLVAAEGEHILGAVGYLYDEHDRNVRITELIAQDEGVKGSLLRLAVEEAEQKHSAELIKCDVSAHSPRIQQTLLEMGFLPTAYVPGMVFHQTHRPDVVMMAKLNVPWNLGPVELTEASRQYFDLVAPAFERASAERAHKQLLSGVPLLAGLSAVELDFLQRACEAVAPAPGAALAGDRLYFVVAGEVTRDGKPLGPGSCFGAGALLGAAGGSSAVAGTGARLLALTPIALRQLSERYPRLGVKLYQNLSAHREADKASSTDT